MLILLLPLLSLFNFSTPHSAPIELKGYFRCRESLIEGTQDALVCYAPTQGGCNAGRVILAYERRHSQAGRKPMFDIADTVQVRVSAQRRAVAIARCTAGGKSRQYFVVFDATATGARPHLSHIVQAWGVNTKGRLTPVAVKTIQCANEDFSSN
ncbi:hypothetical protein [Hymenobacter properus]|uniref:Uncharacterized protein n=1 Tax=Hymenobacter properus TaxID=2791026 RepID=A0A931FGK8_9BACT|nr:hypothetical protein [Hymenobacter properus]MBF9140067.1 hypothetical protein [Hymenobacter properus]MBR7718874.1 hypothetical protein [Microvirga sp. SRT04]